MKAFMVKDNMKKYFIFCIVFAALCSLSCAVPACGAVAVTASTGSPSETTVKDLETAGFEAISAENWTGLLSIADSGLSLDPEDPVFYAMKGYASRKLGNSTAALQADTRAIEIQPNAVRYANRGVTYLSLGNYSAALSDGKASAAIEPDYETAYALEAMAYLGMNETAAAQEAIDRALAIDPESAHSWHVQGLIAMKTGNSTLAVSSLQRSIAIDPDYSLPWPTMANATADLEMVLAQTGAAASPEEETAARASPAVAVTILTAAGALFLARRT